MGQETDKSEGWVWVIVTIENGEESVLALTGEDEEIKIVPVFESKEDGLAGQAKLIGDSYKGELQAIRLDDLTEMAKANSAQVIVVDRDGQPKRLLEDGDQSE